MGLQLRQVQRIVKGTHVSEGAGVDVCRTLGSSTCPNFDPYLMLDELRCPSTEAAAGFPGAPPPPCFPDLSR